MPPPHQTTTTKEQSKTKQKTFTEEIFSAMTSSYQIKSRRYKMVEMVLGDCLSYFSIL